MKRRRDTQDSGDNVDGDEEDGIGKGDSHGGNVYGSKIKEITPYTIYTKHRLCPLRWNNQRTIRLKFNENDTTGFIIPYHFMDFWTPIDEFQRKREIKLNDVAIGCYITDASFTVDLHCVTRTQIISQGSTISENTDICSDMPLYLACNTNQKKSYGTNSWNELDHLIKTTDKVWDADEEYFDIHAFKAGLSISRDFTFPKLPDGYYYDKCNIIDTSGGMVHRLAPKRANLIPGPTFLEKNLSYNRCIIEKRNDEFGVAASVQGLKPYSRPLMMLARSPIQDSTGNPMKLDYTLTMKTSLNGMYILPPDAPNSNVNYGTEIPYPLLTCNNNQLYKYTVTCLPPTL